ncbi:hypothetical protein [Clostridium perfringens]|uniref:hypothetical protein n=1 Tax=Clostridium perfringens TaxID=1502 RepID=UPI001B816436|nr:hypothetical protein [Clostridium perfringens]HBC2034834.1 hypothetical protein [Clostridium perfringens]HBC2057982.1 hypothetical protein [Clostridium perfringens]HBC2072185.1 hypothetical protein [Clostridium perfringens]
MCWLLKVLNKPRSGSKDNSSLADLFKESNGVISPQKWEVTPLTKIGELCRIISLDQFIIENLPDSKETAIEKFYKISKGYNFILEVMRGRNRRYLSVEYLNSRLDRDLDEKGELVDER